MHIANLICLSCIEDFPKRILYQCVRGRGVQIKGMKNDLQIAKRFADNSGIFFGHATDFKLAVLKRGELEDQLHDRLVNPLGAT